MTEPHKILFDQIEWQSPQGGVRFNNVLHLMPGAHAVFMSNLTGPARVSTSVKSSIMRADLSLSAVVCLLCGCAHGHFTQGGGDVGQFIVQKAVAWGGHPIPTNALPAVKCRWRYSDDPDGLVIYLPRGEYPAIESFLGKAFGWPQFGPVDTTDGCNLGFVHKQLPILRRHMHKMPRTCSRRGLRSYLLETRSS